MKHFDDLCYECKLCFIICPYTPPHEFAIDVPRLVLRAKAVNARQAEPGIASRFLADPDLLGGLGCAAAPLANATNQQPLARQVMQRALGIDPRAKLPRFTGQTFASWWAHRPPPATKGTNGKVALFYSCPVNYYQPQIGVAAVKTLERNGVEVIRPAELLWHAALDEGRIDFALGHMERNVERLARGRPRGLRDRGARATCGMMLRKEYANYLHTEDAQLVADHTRDLAEYLVRLIVRAS